MIRRSPTRIDMRLDDVQEYEELQKTRDAKKKAERQSSSSSSMNPPVWGGKVPQSEIQERIGYVLPQNSSAHSRITVNESQDTRIT